MPRVHRLNIRVDIEDFSRRSMGDTHRIGLLRTAGPSYQFRHAELQDRLAAEWRSRHLPTTILRERGGERSCDGIN